MSLNDITEPEPLAPPVGDAVEPLITTEVEAIQEFINTDGETKKKENPTSSVSTASSTEVQTAPVSGAVKTPESTVPPVQAKPASMLDMLLSKALPITEHRISRKMLVFSHPGVGKTSLWGQIPNNFIIDTEQGATVLAQNAENVAEGVVVYPFKTFAATEFAATAFKNAEPQLDKFTTVTIDTANTLKKRMLSAILERQFAENPTANNRYVPGEGGKEHQESNEQMRQLIQGFMDSGRDVVISCHAKTFEYKNKPDVIRPDFSEGLGNTLAGMVDVVAYMYIAEVEGVPTRVMKFTPAVGTSISPEIMAKTRIKGLPSNMLNPTWDKIIDIWE